MATTFGFLSFCFSINDPPQESGRNVLRTCPRERTSPYNRVVLLSLVPSDEVQTRMWCSKTKRIKPHCYCHHQTHRSNPRSSEDTYVQAPSREGSKIVAITRQNTKQHVPHESTHFKKLSIFSTFVFHFWKLLKFRKYSTSEQCIQTVFHFSDFWKKKKSDRTSARLPHSHWKKGKHVIMFITPLTLSNDQPRIVSANDAMEKRNKDKQVGSWLWTCLNF